MSGLLFASVVLRLFLSYWLTSEDILLSQLEQAFAVGIWLVEAIAKCRIASQQRLAQAVLSAGLH